MQTVRVKTYHSVPTSSSVSVSQVSLDMLKGESQIELDLNSLSFLEDIFNHTPFHTCLEV